MDILNILIIITTSQTSFSSSIVGITSITLLLTSICTTLITRTTLLTSICTTLITRTTLLTSTSTTTSVPTTATTTSISTTTTNYPSRTQACPDNWILFENYCYQVGYSPRTWYEAEQNCRSNGAHLASIHSDLENEFLIGISAVGDLVTDPEGRDHVWIGLNDLFTEGQFEWTDGTPVDYQNWANPTQPDNFGSGLQDCAQLYADEQTNIKIVYKKWNDNDCNGHMRAYVCKKASSKFQKKQEPTAASECSIPWNYFEDTGKCYYVGGNDSFITWPDAQNECVKLESNLASVHSKEENAVIEYLLKKSKYSSWGWLGGLKFEDKWMWIDNSPMDYTHWFHSEPNGDGPCLHMWPAEEGSWNDMRCDDKNWNRQYVCEKPAVKPTHQSCPEDWFPFNKFCYQVSNTSPSQWYAAEFDCISKGGHLASIHSEEENEFLIGLTSQGLDVSNIFLEDQVWIGLHDTRKEGHFEWTDGTPLDYKSWNFNQPDNAHGNENCVILIANQQPIKNLILKKWNDIVCTVNMKNYVCKKSALV